MRHVLLLNEGDGFAHGGFCKLLPVVKGNHFVHHTVHDESRTTCFFHLVNVVEAFSDKHSEPANRIPCHILDRRVPRH